METIESDYSSDESTGYTEVLKSLAINYTDTDIDFSDSDGNSDESLFANRCDLKKSKRSKTHSSENDEGQHRQKKLLERLPTRRPNPKIYNRNALMARENRRKKKEYVESLECQIQAMNRKEKLFKKLVRKQNVKIKKLKHERSYLCGILANKTEIMSLVKTLQKNTNSIPITSSALTYCIPTTGDKQQKQQQQSSQEPLPQELHPENHNLRKENLSSSLLSPVDSNKPKEIDFIESASAIYDSCKYTDLLSLDNWSALLSDDDPTLLFGDNMENGKYGTLNNARTCSPNCFSFVDIYKYI